MNYGGNGDVMKGNRRKDWRFKDLGFCNGKMKIIAELIDRTIKGEDKEKIKEDVLKLTSRFPIY